MMAALRPRVSSPPPPRRVPHRAGGTGSSRPLAIELADLISCDPETTTARCDTYLYEPEVGEEPLGILATAIEAPAFATGGTPDLPAALAEGVPDASDPEAVASLAGTLRTEYYRDPTRDMLASFEAALTAANATAATLVHRHTLEWLGGFHAAVAVFHDATLHVSRTGGASVLLARKGHLTDIGEGLSEPHVRNPVMAFANIASGAVGEGDVLVLATPGLFRLLPRDRLGTFLAGKHPREAANNIRDLLTEATDTAPFALLLLRFARAPLALPAPPSAAPAARLAADALFFSYPRGVLARPRITPRVPLRLRRHPLERAAVILRRGGRLLWHFARVSALPALTRAARRGSANARTALTRTATLTRAGLARARATEPAGPSEKTPGALGSLLPRAEALRRELKPALRAWPTSTKVFVVLTVVFALLFGGSLVQLRRKRVEDAAIRSAREQLEAARVKVDAASAALIYDNVEEARRLLGEARTAADALGGLPYYRDEVSALAQSLQTISDTAERAVRVASPEVVGNFAAATGGAGTLGGLAVVGDDIFAVQTETNAILRLRLSSREVGTVAQRSEGIGRIRRVHALPLEKMLLLATDAPGLGIFDTARGDLSRQEVEPIPAEAKEIRGLATFGSRLYLLLPGAKQVYGYTKTLAGYRGGTPWLAARPDDPVDRAVDLGVDGYLYLLTENGTVRKYLKGSPVDFVQSPLATPLRQPTRLVINETLKHLYVLDPPEKRVVAYDTTGTLTRQFVFESASDLRDIAIGGKEEELYVLDGTTVYKVPLK